MGPLECATRDNNAQQRPATGPQSMLGRLGNVWLRLLHDGLPLVAHVAQSCSCWTPVPEHRCRSSSGHVIRHSASTEQKSELQTPVTTSSLESGPILIWKHDRNEPERFSEPIVIDHQLHCWKCLNSKTALHTTPPCPYPFTHTETAGIFGS